MNKQQIKEAVERVVKTSPMLSSLSDGQVKHILILLEQIMVEYVERDKSREQFEGLTPLQKSKIELADDHINLMKKLWQLK